MGSRISRLRESVQASKREGTEYHGRSAVVLRFAAKSAPRFSESISMKRIVVLMAGSFVAAGLYEQELKPIAVKETVDTLVAKNTDAKGGAQALAAGQTWQLAGKRVRTHGR